MLHEDDAALAVFYFVEKICGMVNITEFRFLRHIFPAKPVHYCADAGIRRLEYVFFGNAVLSP